MAEDSQSIGDLAWDSGGGVGVGGGRLDGECSNGFLDFVCDGRAKDLDDGRNCGFAVGGGENPSFEPLDEHASGWHAAVKFVKEELEVGEVDNGVLVIDVGHGVGEAAKAIVVAFVTMGEAGGGTLVEKLGDGRVDERGQPWLVPRP